MCVHNTQVAVRWRWLAGRRGRFLFGVIIGGECPDATELHPISAGLSFQHVLVLRVYVSYSRFRLYTSLCASSSFVPSGTFIRHFVFFRLFPTPFAILTFTSSKFMSHEIAAFFHQRSFLCRSSLRFSLVWHWLFAVITRLYNQATVCVRSLYTVFGKLQAVSMVIELQANAIDFCQYVIN